MRKITAAIATGVALMVAAAASAAMKPASPEQVSEAVQECISVTSPNWIDLAKLQQDGWKIATKTGGRQLMQIRGAYQKRGNETYIVAGKDELRKKQCIVVARLASTTEYHPLAQALAGELGAMPEQDNFTYRWTIGETTVSMDPKGERDAPTAEFVISARKDEQ